MKHQIYTHNPEVTIHAPTMYQKHLFYRKFSVRKHVGGRSVDFFIGEKFMVFNVGLRQQMKPSAERFERLK